MNAHVTTSGGLVRANNEDSFLFLPRYGLFAVADGMGGHVGGEVASRLAVETLQEQRSVLAADPHRSLAAGVAMVHARICQEMERNGGQLYGMGTTLTLCAISNNVAHLAQVGDSAAFLVRGGAVTQLTEKQSNGHILKNVLGGRRDSFHGAQHVTQVLQPQDLLVLATDGLTDYLTDPWDLLTAFRFSSSKDPADNCVRWALAQGGADNVTVIVVRIS